MEFDFVPNTDLLTFQYVFGSEEYNEFVGKAYNDVFGFFLNGSNIALVPGSNDIVSVNSINNNTNSSYYRDNTVTDPATGNYYIDTEMDGLTVVLNIQVPVTQGQINHIKLVIADAGDSRLDSNVLISGFESVISTSDLESSSVDESSSVVETETSSDPSSTVSTTGTSVPKTGFSDTVLTAFVLAITSVSAIIIVKKRCK